VTVTTPPTLFTIGHSTHPIERFLALLADAAVDVVADVRRYPGSRRNPQFGADALAESLSREAIGYEPFGEQLGGRRRGSAASREGTAAPARDNSAWRNASFRAYADYLDDPAFESGLERLEALATGRPAAIMCAEAHPSNCHRRLIADVLVVRGWSVTHLLADGRRAAHELSPHAAVDDGVLSYPGPPQLGDSV
jgi:uncharacterized protein (DUF488 family)